MTVIIDSSALVAYLLEESEFEKIRDLLTEGVDSPALLVVEVSNAILEAGKNKRVAREGAEKAIGVMLNLLESNIRIHDEVDLVESSFNIAADRSLTIYDSIYLALAKKLNGSLASRDRKQVEAARTLEIETVST